MAWPVVMLVIAAALPAAEEAFFAFDPRPTPPAMATRLGLEARWYALADDRDDGSGRLGFDRERLSVSHLAWRGMRDEGWLDLRGQRTGIRGDAVLPGGVEPAGTYAELAAGATWKRLLGGGDLVGLRAAAVADGQPPLPSGMEWSGTATLFGRIGLGEEGRDGLLLALDYDSDRIVLAGVPVLPLVAWQGQRGPWVLVLGVPFSLVTWRSEAARVTAVLGPLPALTADVRLHGPLRLAAEARWTRWRLRRTDRPRDEDRLHLSQWEWSGGLRFAAGPALGADLMVGAATARRLGEDEEADDARRDGLALTPAAFLALRGRIAF